MTGESHNEASVEESHHHHHQVVSMLKLDLEARGEKWDEPPCLAFIYDKDGQFHLSDLDLPISAWRPHPAAGLMAMARSMEYVTMNVKGASELLTGNRPESWKGIAYFSEAWMVIQHGKELDPVLEDMAGARMLSIHPDRVEVRGWWALMADDSWLMIVSQRRDTGEIISDGCSIVNGISAVADGTVVDALVIIAGAITGSRS